MNENVENTAIEETVTVEETNQKFVLEGWQRNQILIRSQDLGAQYASYAAQDRLQEWYAKFGHLQAMYKGIAPYEEVEVGKTIELKRRDPQEKLFAVDFIVHMDNARSFKETVKRCFNLVHHPHAQTKAANGRPDFMEGHPEYRRFKVWEVSATDVEKFVEANKQFIIAHDLYRWAERDLDGPQAETTLPESNAQKKQKKQSASPYSVKRGEKRQAATFTPILEDDDVEEETQETAVSVDPIDLTEEE